MKGYLFFIITALLLIFFASVSAMPLFIRENVLILTYHRLSPDSSMANEYTVTPDTFENDINLLKNQGYEFLKASQLANTDLKGRKIAVITFDDGYLSDIEYAMPLLKKHSACATFFIIGEMVGKSGYMSCEQVKELSQKEFCEIGNHSYSIHSKFPSTITLMYRSNKYNDSIISDFKKNNEFLQEITGVAPVSVSYPNGIYNLTVDKALHKYGILTTFCTAEIPYKSEITPIGRKNRGKNRNINNFL